MVANPLVGIVYHWLGGVASASFYIPYRGVKKWSWETYWLAGGVFSWIIAPWTLALALVPDLMDILRATPTKTLFWTYFFGALWGVGGLTFGLTMRYLGIALGMAVALGYCAAFGTLMPPIFEGRLVDLLSGRASQVVLFGIAACLAGIGLSGMAGVSKERELSDEKKKATVKEFNLVKGMLLATFSGIMSACFSYGLTAGAPIAASARQRLIAAGSTDLWQNLPVLVVVLLGGFTSNLIWCVILHKKNRSGAEYFATRDARAASVPLLANYAFSAVAGVTWYLQFFFYGMGETRMGAYKFSSWTMHMASIIIFSTCWGMALGEWRGISRRTRFLVGAGLAILVTSTVIVGYGNYLKSSSG